MALSGNTTDYNFNTTDYSFGFPVGFSFEIQTSGSDDTFTLPLITGGTFNFVCQWGDGNSNTITSYNQAEATHTYSVEGTYIIKMMGTCTKFAFNNAGDKTMITKLLSCYDMGFDLLNFYGCSNLTEVCSLGSLESLTTLYRGFQNCSSIVSPPDLSSCVNITTMEACFAYCSSLTSPPDLSSCVDITTLSYCFYNCGSMVSPPDLSNCVDITTLSYCFQGCSSMTSPPNLSSCVDITNMQSCFQSCSSMTSPPDLSSCVDITNMQSCFQGCSSMTSLPDLSSCINITNMAYCFRDNDMAILEADLLANLTSCSNVGFCFYDNSNMTGSGLDFISACPASITGGTTTNCFSGCTTLSDYASIPSAWGGGGA